MVADTPNNPALHAFLEALQDETIWGQVLIEKASGRLRHVDDRAIPVEKLKGVRAQELRQIATYNPAGQFRPLRSAPDLQRGWFITCPTPAALWRALQELYPGSIPDWFATRQTPPPVTDYRPFTNRQSGMYRITQLLTDAQAAQTIRACCSANLCLKQRLWSVADLPPDTAAQKSLIPCLEPCALLLELARKEARIEQEEKTNVTISPSDLQTLVLASRAFLHNRGGEVRVGEISSPLNPRRVQLVLEKFGPKVNDLKNAE